MKTSRENTTIFLTVREIFCKIFYVKGSDNIWILRPGSLHSRAGWMHADFLSLHMYGHGIPQTRHIIVPVSTNGWTICTYNMAVCIRDGLTGYGTIEESALRHVHRSKRNAPCIEERGGTCVVRPSNFAHSTSNREGEGFVKRRRSSPESHAPTTIAPATLTLAIVRLANPSIASTRKSV